MSSRPHDIRSRSPGTSPGGSPLPSSHSRNPLIARLASPVPSNPHLCSLPGSQVPTPAQIATDKQAELPAVENPSSLPSPGQSALAAALARCQDQGNTLIGTPPRRAPFPAAAGPESLDRVVRSNYGSFDTREATGSPVPLQDPDIVRRHLVQPGNGSGRY